MGAVSADELAGEAMRPTWAALAPVKARDEALTRFLHEELPVDAKLDVAGMNYPVAEDRRDVAVSHRGDAGQKPAGGLVDAMSLVGEPVRRGGGHGP
ncbi:hypothetical protein [Mycobacterium sp.]|uniref:hypothetical protein n=1 Tax=Mycobacterium sp. TaxID=1785 RepID=UPI003F9C5516